MGSSVGSFIFVALSTLNIAVTFFCCYRFLSWFFWEARHQLDWVSLESSKSFFSCSFPDFWLLLLSPAVLCICRSLCLCFPWENVKFRSKWTVTCSPRWEYCTQELQHCRSRQQRRYATGWWLNLGNIKPHTDSQNPRIRDVWVSSTQVLWMYDAKDHGRPHTGALTIRHG